MESATGEKLRTLQMTSIESNKTVNKNEEFNDKEETVRRFVLPSGKNEQLEDTEDIDFIFDHIVGNGKWTDFGQWILFTSIILIAYCGIFPIFMHIYAAYEPPHRCFIPNCDTYNTSSDVNVNWISFASPTVDVKGKQTCQTEMLKEDASIDPCRRYSANHLASCNIESFNQTDIQVCQKFIYDTSIVEESLTTKFNLVCDMEYQQMLLGSVVMVGLMIGSPIGGKLSDKFGRKHALLFSVLLTVPTVMFAGYSSNFWIYAALKLINTMALPCIWFTSHILITEIFGKDYRQNAVVVKELMWPIGMMMVIAVFYFTRHYVWFHLWIGAMCTLTIPAFIIAPESPRWLSANGKWEAAEHVLLRIARWNRKKLSSEEKQKISSILKKLDSKLNFKQEKKLGVFDLMNPDIRKETFIMTLNWIIVCVTSFTLSFNVTRLSGDVYVNSTLLVVLGDIPGKFFTWLMLKYCSRRFSLFSFQFLAGLFCVIIAFLPKKYELAVVAFYMLANCSSNAAFAMVYLITGELYPTNLRTQALSTCSTISRIFGISAAFIPKLSCVWKPLPMLILGVPSIIIGCLSYYLPETKNKNLPLAMTKRSNST